MGTVRNGVYYSDYNGDEIDNLLDKTVWQTNPNLLDNWYFAGGGSQQGGGQFPINQRGKASYTKSTDIYTIDRWRIFGMSSMVLESDGISFTSDGSGDSHFLQMNENGKIPPGIYTVSLLVESISGYCNMGAISTSIAIEGSGLFSVTVEISASSPSRNCYILNYLNGTIKIKAAKLELGDTQTLAHQENGVWVLNEVPNYQEQLFRCQTSKADPYDNYANKINTVNAPPPLYQYDGEDLTVKFASEIAQYSDVCAWLKARLAAKNISGIFVKDFFKFTTSNNVTLKARAGDINHDLGYGATEVTKYHIDFICDELWPDNHVWNKVNYNNGIASEPSPWCASDLYHFLNSLSGNVPNGTGADPATVAVDYTSTGVLDKFPAWLRDAIVERRSLEPTRYTAGALLTDDNSWAWKNIGKLWVPSEVEYYGFVAWGTRNGYSIGEGHMYPLMRDSKMRIKRRPNGSRCGLWLRRANSGGSARAARCGSAGDAGDDDCANAWVAPPVCFRIMAI